MISSWFPLLQQFPNLNPRESSSRKKNQTSLISNYEKFHTNTSPIQTTESMFERRYDGTVRMTFRPPPTAPEESPRLSFTYSAMVTAVQIAQKKLPITGFKGSKLFGETLWTKRIFQRSDENNQPFKSTCKKPHLSIKCKSDKDCTCSTKKKSHFQKYRYPHKKNRTSSKPKKPYCFFRKKNPTQSSKSKSSHCFIYKKKGHFARNCPNRPSKSVRLIEHLQSSSMLSDNDDVESFFS